MYNARTAPTIYNTLKTLNHPNTRTTDIQITFYIQTDDSWRIGDGNLGAPATFFEHVAWEDIDGVLAALALHGPLHVMLGAVSESRSEPAKLDGMSAWYGRVVDLWARRHFKRCGVAKDRIELRTSGYLLNRPHFLQAINRLMY